MMFARIAETVALSPVYSGTHESLVQAESLVGSQSSSRLQPWMWNLGMSSGNVERDYRGMLSNSSSGVAGGRMVSDRLVHPDVSLDWKKLGLSLEQARELYNNRDDDNGYSLTSLVNGYKAAANFGINLPRVAGSFVQAGCAELNGSALGLSTSIPPAVPKSLFEFGGNGSCSTPSFCVAGSPVTVPAMPPSTRPRHKILASDAGLVSSFDGANHDPARCLSPSMVESDYSNSSASLSFDENSLHEDGHYDMNPCKNFWIQQQAENFVDSRFWIMQQPTTMSDHASARRPNISTCSTIPSHFSGDVPLPMNPRLDDVTAGIGKLGHLVSLPEVHAVVENDESTHSRGSRWCSPQEWIDHSMQSSGQQVASVPASEERLYTRSPGREGAEALNTMHLAAGAITSRKRSNIEAMDQTSAAADSRALNVEDSLAGLVSRIPPHLHRLGGLASQGAKTTKFRTLEDAGCEVLGRKLDPAAVSALLYETHAANQQNHRFHLSDSSDHLGRPPPKMRRRHGTATDPQSIAARTRREKFSDRIRILQTLVPNGERLDTVSTLGQTLEYVRFLQHQVWEFYNGNEGAHESETMPEKWKEFKEHTITGDHIVT